VAVVSDRQGTAGLFQQVTVPSGTDSVRFAYRPPHELPAAAAAAVALLALVVSLLAHRFRGKRPSGVARH
jgi:hypothetical protein